MRELYYMVKGKCAETWDHTAAQMALTINMNRKRGSKMVSAFDLNPYRKRPRQRPTVRLNSADSMKLLKQVFIDHQPVNVKALEMGKME